jgi:hypothetical protein
MNGTLDVLVLENGPGGARDAIDELEAAGHRVHRCHELGAASFPCRGVVDPSDCPLEGPIDVALLVRHHVHPQPSPLEDGVACALKAGVPVVEEGPGILDPYDPWITGRVEGTTVVQACENAVAAAFQPLVDDVLARCALVLSTAGIDPTEVSCRMELAWPRLLVHLEVPGPVSRGVREALAVRALDAVRATRRTFDTVNVQVHENLPVG